MPLIFYRYLRSLPRKQGQWKTPDAWRKWAVSSSWATDERCRTSILQHLCAVRQSAEPCLASIAMWSKTLPLGQSHCHAPRHAFTSTPSHGRFPKCEIQASQMGLISFTICTEQTSLIYKMSMLINNTELFPPTPPLTQVPPLTKK